MILSLAPAILLLSTISYCQPADFDFSTNLTTSLYLADGVLRDMRQRWQLIAFPLILRSCHMSEGAYDSLVQRMISKIINHATTTIPQRFVVAFTGSSVTAGHDSLYSQSFPSLLQEIMTPALAALGVSFESRNSALGNNPCFPYDVCVHMFVGDDADLVHWEQSYNCGFGDKSVFIEQFIRQSVLLPSRPIVVLSGSSTANWHARDCPDAATLAKRNSTAPSVNDLKFVQASVRDLVSRLNANQMRHWDFIKDIVKAYRNISSLQMFTHDHHAQYKCLGPYIPTWGDGSASWHPSVLGHELRAFNHAYVWLNAWKDAVKIVQSETALGRTAEEHTTNTHTPVEELLRSAGLGEPIHKLHPPVVDKIQCYSEYVPRQRINETSLLKLVRKSSLAANATSLGLIGSHTGGWFIHVFEVVNSCRLEMKMIENAKRRGYQDFKYALYGSRLSGPLQIDFTAKQNGYMFICDNPSLRKPHHIYDYIWNSRILLSIQRGDSDQQVSVGYSHNRLFESCITVEHLLTAGEYTLSIRVNATDGPDDNHIMFIASIIVP